MKKLSWKDHIKYNENKISQNIMQFQETVTMQILSKTVNKELKNCKAFDLLVVETLCNWITISYLH